MKIYAVVFLLGVSTSYFFSTVPPWWLFWVAAFLCLLLPLSRIAAVFIVGIGWMLYASQQILSWTLPQPLISQAVVVEGTIASLPVNQDHAVNFLFCLDHVDHKSVTSKVELSWYKQPTNNRFIPDLTVGDRWQLVVRLKPPHNLANPGSFDSEKFLFAHGIRAVGYVVDQQPQLLIKHGGSHWVDQLRQRILIHMQHDLAGKPYAAFIYALTIGEKFAISSQQWQVLQNTGTNHLMAIAGLHIGFIAGLVFLVVKFIWCLIPYAPLWIPASQVAAVASLVGAGTYSLLAGLDIPTQRAMIMLGVLLLGNLSRRYIPVGYSIAIAMIWVLIGNPLSVLEVSFWLSFGAVSLLVYGLAGRFNANTLWWMHGRTQWVLSIGLVPLTLLFFSNASLISPLANSIAIPWIGFITVPLSLLAGLLSLFTPTLASHVFIAAESTLHGILAILTFLAAQPEFSWQHSAWQFWFIFPAIIGILLLLAPRGLPNRWLGVWFILPILCSVPPQPASHELWFTLLDVGQGLSAVVQTQQHVLVFDTGAKLSQKYDMGHAVVVPFLRQQGINKVDKLVISHGDNDHIGGAAAVLQAFPVDQIETSVPARFLPRVATTCFKGEQWQWDGIIFRFLYPTKTTLGLTNNSSCVLKISTGKQQILLIGDIEKLAEKMLLREAAELNAQIIVAPHHGSNTSSTPGFLAAVKPNIVLFPVGYLNRFGFPKPQVVARYQALGAQVYDTANNGAITVYVNQAGLLTLHCYSARPKHIWNQ